MPVTLLYASILGLLFLGLSALVAQARGRHKVFQGTQGNPQVERAMRVQANFVEYVPLALILMALLEDLQSSRYGLHVVGILLVVARLLHAWGLSRPSQPNAARGLGAMLTFCIILACCIWGLWRALFALSVLQ